MYIKNSIDKIKSIINKSISMDEDDVRSLMILIRKKLEEMSQIDRDLFLTLNLFCDWTAHIKIDKSNTGLRILAKINDTLVENKNSQDIIEIQKKMSGSIGFSILRDELALFLKKILITDILVTDNNAWLIFINNLIEIIRDTPLLFPPLNSLNKSQQNIYDKIVSNPIKIGAGVISIKISLIKYPAPMNEIMCLVIKTEDTTNFIIPLIIEIS